MINRAGQAGKKLWQFVTLLWSRFATHRGPENAAMLTYTTLLSIVPLMTVVFAILSAFPVAEKMGEAIQNFIFQNFVPTSGEVIQQYLGRFAENASRLSGASFLFLVLVAFLMMREIDRALNVIWEARRQRSTLNKFLIYWALLSLGPVLVAVSLAASSYLISLPMLVEAEETLGLGQRLIGVTPIVSSALAFMLMYVVIPNRRVRLRDAVLGGLLAALLFELAKRGFGYYVTSFTNYEAIYGALAVIPIFLVWLYLSWMIFLFGAEFTHCLDLYRHCPGKGMAEHPGLPEYLALLSVLQTAHKRGEVLSMDDINDRNTGGTGPRQVEEMLARLASANIVMHTDKNAWAMVQDPAEITLYDLMTRLEVPLPASTASGDGEDPWQGVLLEPMDAAYEGLRHSLDVSLESVLDSAAIE